MSAPCAYPVQFVSSLHVLSYLKLKKERKLKPGLTKLYEDVIEMHKVMGDVIEVCLKVTYDHFSVHL